LAAVASFFKQRILHDGQKQDDAEEEEKNESESESEQMRASMWQGCEVWVPTKYSAAVDEAIPFDVEKLIAMQEADGALSALPLHFPSFHCSSAVRYCSRLNLLLPCPASLEPLYVQYCGAILSYASHVEHLQMPMSESYVTSGLIAELVGLRRLKHISFVNVSSESDGSHHGLNVIAKVLDMGKGRYLPSLQSIGLADASVTVQLIVQLLMLPEQVKRLELTLWGGASDPSHLDDEKYAKLKGFLSANAEQIRSTVGGLEEMKVSCLASPGDEGEGEDAEECNSSWINVVAPLHPHLRHLQYNGYMSEYTCFASLPHLRSLALSVSSRSLQLRRNSPSPLAQCSELEKITFSMRRQLSEPLLSTVVCFLSARLPSLQLITLRFEPSKQLSSLIDVESFFSLLQSVQRIEEQRETSARKGIAIRLEMNAQGLAGFCGSQLSDVLKAGGIDVGRPHSDMQHSKSCVHEVTPAQREAILHRRSSCEPLSLSSRKRSDAVCNSSNAAIM
jgi:hypothetical protein